jgi:hypothetical protein
MKCLLFALPLMLESAVAPMRDLANPISLEQF